MSPTKMAKVLSASAMLAAVACSDNAMPAPAAVPPQPTQTAQNPAASTPPAATAPAPVATPVATPAPAAPPAAMPPAPAGTQQTPPNAPMMPPAGTGGAAATPPATPDPAMPAEPGAKEYTFDEIMMMKRDDLIAAWSAAPAEKIWTGCSGEYTQLEHGSDGAPRDTTPAGWGGKCIPDDTKVLYNIIAGAPGSPAIMAAELKASFLDMKQAVVVTYSGGTTLHFRNMGKDIWVGRQAMGMSASGIWYPLGMITGTGNR